MILGFAKIAGGGTGVPAGEHCRTPRNSHTLYKYDFTVSDSLEAGLHALRIARQFTCSCCSHATEPICGYQWCWLSENKAGVGGAGGGLAENRPVFGTADYVPPKKSLVLVFTDYGPGRYQYRWCWYSKHQSASLILILSPPPR